MNDKYFIFTIAGGLFLFGSLLISGITNNSVWFVFGYPASVVSLVLAYRFRLVDKK